MLFRRPSALLALGGLLACASCSLLVDTSDLAGVRPGGDASAPEAASSDAAADVADAGLSTRCDDPSVVLCEPFDTASSVTRYSADVDPETSVGTDDTIFVSPPRSALFRIAANTSNTSADATIGISANATLADFAFEGSFHIEVEEPGAIARLLMITTGTGRNILYNRNGSLRDSGDLLLETSTPSAGTWHRVVVEVRTSKAPPTVTISLDAVQNAPAQLAATWASGPVVVRLGISETAAPVAGWVVRWDDVLVRKL